MDLYVMRHGLAGRRDAGRFPNDDDRPLTGKGRRQIVRQAKGLNAINLTLDVIVTSPLARSAQTAERVHRRLLSPGRLITSAALKPSAHPSELMDELATEHSSASSVMIVGHEPYLSQLISVLVAGEPSAVGPDEEGRAVQAAHTFPQVRALWLDRVVHDRRADGEARVTATARSGPADTATCV